jgi:hypothetical protein
MEEEMKFVTKFATALLLIALMVSFMPAAAAQPVKAATCYWAQFIADVTVPDGTTYSPGATFKKTWRLKNIGTCAWSSTDVSLIFDSGEKMGAPASVALPTTVNPGQTVDITVDMTAPSTAGHYFGYYKFKSAAVESLVLVQQRTNLSGLRSMFLPPPAQVMTLQQTLHRLHGPVVRVH